MRDVFITPCDATPHQPYARPSWGAAQVNWARRGNDRTSIYIRECVFLNFNWEAAVLIGNTSTVSRLRGFFFPKMRELERTPPDLSRFTCPTEHRSSASARPGPWRPRAGTHGPIRVGCWRVSRAVSRARHRGCVRGRTRKGTPAGGYLSAGAE